MQTYCVNLDYEWRLFNKNLSRDVLKKVQLEFEFIYFFIETHNTTLKSEFKYPEYYLDFISSLGAVIPLFSDLNSKALNWWGDLNNIPLEKSLNSKLTSYLVSRELNILPQAIELVENLKELEEYLKRNEKMAHTFIAKDLESMGGQGNLVFEKNNLEQVGPKIIKMLKNGKIIISPFFDRINDYGICYDISCKKINVNQNFNTKFGIFRGGFSILEQEKWPNLVNSLFPVFDAYVKIGAYGQLQIDSFDYRGPLGLENYPLVEVNFRKTMGSFIRRLNYLFEDKIKSPALVIIYIEDLKIDLFSYPRKEIFDRFGFEIISPQYLLDFKSGIKIFLKNIFLVLSMKDSNNHHNMELLSFLKPNSSSSILMRDHILKLQN